MRSRPDNALARSLRPSVALLSIAGFWLFYFSINTIRSGVIFGENQGHMLGRRAAVTLISMGITWLVYRLLAPIPTGALKRGVITASFLAIPAAVAYATVNFYAFEHHPKAVHAHGRDHNGSGGVSPSRPPPTMMVQVGEMRPEHEPTNPFKEIADSAVNGYFFFAAWAALYLALCYAAEVGALERRAATLRAAAQAAELRALRYQVNPHFLFNTLNSLSSLVMTGRPEAAEKMIINLANFFRTSLSGDPTADVPLAEEIRLQRLYLSIEQVRFPERLIAEIAIPDALNDACVPGLILQPLVENAVKYGVSRSRRPVTIGIGARLDGASLVLTVHDDGESEPAEAADKPGVGVGLANVRDRLTARFGEAAGCRWGPAPEGGYTVTLTMPLVRDEC